MGSDITDAIEIDICEFLPGRHGGILEQTANLDLPNPTKSSGELHPQLSALDHRYLLDEGSHIVKEGPANGRALQGGTEGQKRQNLRP